MSALKENSSTDMKAGPLNYSYFSDVGSYNALISNKKIRTISIEVVRHLD